MKVALPAGSEACMAGSKACLAGSKTCLAGSKACLAGSKACLAGSKACLAGSWALKAELDEWTDGRSNRRTKNHPILRNFVSHWPRCPATVQLRPKNYIKRGKDTADHMMPLGNWFFFITDKTQLSQLTSNKKKQPLSPHQYPKN